MGFSQWIDDKLNSHNSGSDPQRPRPSAADASQVSQPNPARDKASRRAADERIASTDSAMAKNSDLIPGSNYENAKKDKARLAAKDSAGARTAKDLGLKNK